MKGIVFCLLGLLIGVESSGQLVRRKDYDLAVALQAGGGTSVGIPFRDVRMFVVPVGGLKMTIPFTRKWFLGTEVNYADHRFDSRYAPGENTDRKQKVRFRLKELQLPVYLKYMLNWNRASLLFGGYAGYYYQNKSGVSGPDPAVALDDETEKWNAGLTFGYEYRIVKHLNVMCRVSAGLNDLMHSRGISGKNVFPLQACITVSYDIFRVGDCGCD